MLIKISTPLEIKNKKLLPDNKLVAQLNSLRYILKRIDYSDKKDLEPRIWDADETNRSMMFLNVKFDNLSEEQYKLLSRLKQYL